MGRMKEIDLLLDEKGATTEEELAEIRIARASLAGLILNPREIERDLTAWMEKYMKVAKKEEDDNE